MNATEFKDLCKLFGSGSEVARILGLKSTRRLRRVTAGEVPLNPRWLDTLKVEAKERIKLFEVFLNNTHK